MALHARKVSGAFEKRAPGPKYFAFILSKKFPFAYNNSDYYIELFIPRRIFSDISRIILDDNSIVKQSHTQSDVLDYALFVSSRSSALWTKRD